MKTIILSFFTCLFLQSTIISAEEIPDYAGKYTSTPKDTKAINKVIDDFQRALKENDGELLRSLLMSEDITFFSPPDQELIDQIRDQNDKFDFWKSFRFNQANNFIKGISTEGNNIEERFYNIKITQDKNYALVVFDYDFRSEGKVSNWGIETWQMFKLDGKWLIATVMWSMNMAPKPEK